MLESKPWTNVSNSPTLLFVLQLFWPILTSRCAVRLEDVDAWSGVCERKHFYKYNFIGKVALEHDIRDKEECVRLDEHCSKLHNGSAGLNTVTNQGLFDSHTWVYS